MGGFGFTFEGRAVSARPGQTLAAALAEAGELALRETRTGGSRGLFCGMGVCQECLVTVDGRPNQRACATKAEAGQDVRRQPFPGEPPAAARGAPPMAFEDLAVERADLVVVGGGAGGLSAAIAARAGGLDVLLLDERPTAGGQYYKQPPAGYGPLDRQQRDGAALRARAEREGVRILDGVEVWSAVDAGTLLATGQGRTLRVEAKALVIATGAYERGVPLPGWTLPGVMTTGALQTLWRSYRALPGRRIAIAGNGPLNLQVACEVMAAGAEVVLVAEAAPILAAGRLGHLARMALAEPALTAKGAAMLARAASGGARLAFGQVARRIEQRGNRLAVEVGPLAGGAGRRVEADVVALGYGFQPSNELLRALGCGHDYDAQIGALRTRRTADCETTVPNVFAVGDCCGLGGAPAARAEGTIAGIAAVARLAGSEAAAALAPRLAEERRALAGHRRFQAALWKLYEAPRAGLSLADDDTLVCRCEEVGKREIVAALEGAPAIGEVKRRTRCGMGRCQGRYCGPILVEELAARGRPADELAGFAPRGPVKPVTIADLVGSARP